jgi:hypothetical protein
MLEVIATLDKARTGGGLRDEPDSFIEAAVRWSSHVLRTHRGELLERGLKIAQALAEYQDRLDGIQPQERP